MAGGVGGFPEIGSAVMFARGYLRCHAYSRTRLAKARGY